MQVAEANPATTVEAVTKCPVDGNPDGTPSPTEAASSVYDLHESVEPMGNVVAKTMLFGVADTLLQGLDPAPTRSTILTVNDRSSGEEIYRHTGITLQVELDEIRGAIEADLANLSVDAFHAKYAGKRNVAGSAVQLSDTRVCDECNRTIARSEMMRFNTAYTRRAGWDVLCPACGDERTRNRLFGQAPSSYVVKVPNQDFLADCVRSYLAHGWSSASRSSGETRLTKGRRLVTVRIIS